MWIILLYTVFTVILTHFQLLIYFSKLCTTPRNANACLHRRTVSGTADRHGLWVTWRSCRWPRSGAKWRQMCADMRWRSKRPISSRRVQAFPCRQTSSASVCLLSSFRSSPRRPHTHSASRHSENEPHRKNFRLTGKCVTASVCAPTCVYPILMGLPLSAADQQRRCHRETVIIGRNRRERKSGKKKIIIKWAGTERRKRLGMADREVVQHRETILSFHK